MPYSPKERLIEVPYRPHIYNRFARKTEMPKAQCPDCEEKVFVEAGKELGAVVLCEDCDSRLEVVGLDPLELDPYHESDEESYDDGFNIFDNE